MQQRFHKNKRDPDRLPPREITDRSIEIISFIERYKFLPTSFVCALAGGNKRITQRHLQSLYHKGFINRVGNPGEFIYYIDDTRSLTLLVNSGADRETLDFEGVKRNKEKAYSDINFGTRIDDMQGSLMHLLHHASSP